MNDKYLNDYLSPHSEVIIVPETKGEWNRDFHETLFIKTHEYFFENYYCSTSSSKKHRSVTARQYELIKDGKFQDIIPNSLNNFFDTANQALQIIHDNDDIQDEILKNDKFVYLPCKGSSGVCFVIEIFKFFGLIMGPRSFTGHQELIEVKKKCIFILPVR